MDNATENTGKVTRYAQRQVNGDMFMDESLNGEYVEFSDYSKLQTECEELRKRCSLNYGGGFTEDEITIHALRNSVAKLEQTLSALDSEIAKVGVDINCNKCGGEGVCPEHNDHSFDEEGHHDCSHCPVPVQCDDCRATGIDQVKAQLEVQRLRILVAKVKAENEEKEKLLKKFEYAKYGILTLCTRMQENPDEKSHLETIKKILLDI